MKNLIRTLCTSLALFIILLPALGQGVKFGNNKATVNAGSLLELESTNKGFLQTRINLISTTSWTPLLGTGVTGMQVFNTNTNITSSNTSYPILTGGAGIYYWDGSGWVGVTPVSAITDKFWSLSGNSSTNPGSNALGAATDGNYLGTKDAQNLVIGTAGVKRVLIDQKGNAFGGGSTSAAGVNNFSWGYNNTFGATNPRFSLAFGNGNTINNSTSVGVFAIGTNHQVEGLSSGSGAAGFGAKIYNSTYSYSFGNPATFTSGTPNGYSIYNSAGSVILGTNNKVYGNATGNNLIFGTGNTINGYDGCVLLGGTNVTAASGGNMVLYTGGSSNSVSGSAFGNDLTGVFTGGYRFFTGIGSTAVNTTSNTAGQVLIYNPSRTSSTAAASSTLMGVGVDTSLSSGTAGYTGDMHSTLQVGGSFALPIRSVSTNTTVTGNDFTIICTAAVTITLPSVTQCAGRIYQIAAENSSGTVTVNNAGGGTVMKNGSSSATATVGLSSNQCYQFQSDGTLWHVLLR
ncbi:hypothetical protein [Foetidibacter luteolus]|uniref:hypothetical protein n=1 Tax=Foetidibacter luteolus TaxID=2608880 RepID=UPI00129B6FC6|nr:hypothetical protein [Foetidibacter luteolus]